MKVVVIGGGVAGMFCAGLLGKYGKQVILLEKNSKLGKKMFITGKGRCNVTNLCDKVEFLENVVSNSKFLMSAISKFTSQDTIDFIEENGTPIKIERGNRAFPQSDKSSDIIWSFESFAIKNYVKIMTNSTVVAVTQKDGAIASVVLENGQNIDCDAVVIATGGVSYSSTGSTGDGYKFAKMLGHNIIQPKPALVPILLKNTSFLAGVSLKNVSASVVDNNGKVIAKQFGEMLWTHSGASGPIVLSLSSLINKYYVNGKFCNKFWLEVDLKPALDLEKLDQKFVREFAEQPNILLKNYLPSLTLKAMAEVVADQCKIDGSKRLNSITKQERERLAKVLKGVKFEICGLENINASIITSGGVDTKQINSKDMQSKLVKNLFFAGEVIDVDALTGGFNIQIALSTAFLVAQALNIT